MRESRTHLLVSILTVSAFAQSGPQLRQAHTAESLRGISAVSREIAWASGTHGTYLRSTDAGSTWIPAQVPDATQLDFRAVVAFSENEVFLMSAGPGDQSRIYHTSDAGRHWQLQFTNTNPKGFFDSMVFWDPKHGVVLGDPIPDENGKLKFELLTTDDGQNWRQIPSSRLPEAVEGEAAFAASNTCIALIPSMWGQPPSAVRPGAARHQIATPTREVNSAPALRFVAAIHPQKKKGESAPIGSDPNVWFATGGKVARVFHSPDRGKTWTVSDTPIIHGPDSAGIFSIAFRDALHGMIAGGDYKHPTDDVPNLATTDDGGKTWHLSQTKDLQGYISAIAFDARNASCFFAVGPDYMAITDRSHTAKFRNLKFNTVSVSPEGAAFFVGAKGTIALVPR